MLNSQIGIFASLPVHSLNKLSLQQRLDEISKTLADATKEDA